MFTLDMLPICFRFLLVFAITTCFCFSVQGQVKVPGYYVQDEDFNTALEKIIARAGLDGSYDVGEDGTETISFAVIDLNGEQPVLGGMHYHNFIYPASVYKMYVAMEVLKQVSEGKYSLYNEYVVQSPNDVDRSKEIAFDPRPLLRDGDTVTIHYLLDLMITRSDNSAANCMIDIAGRKNINQTMHANGWHGSEVTRKFLSRNLEDPGYDTIRSTETSALHAADFMYKIQQQELVNPWVSMQLKTLLSMQLDTAKLYTGLPKGVMFSHKSGWWSYYTHDVGIVDDGEVKYIIALFTPIPEEKVRPKFESVARQVHQLMQERHAAGDK